MKRRPTTNENVHEIIALAWDDATSFDAIEAQTGLAEKDVIKIMRKCMKRSSFKMWRRRVTSRTSKHLAQLESLQGIQRNKSVTFHRKTLRSKEPSGEVETTAL